MTEKKEYTPIITEERLFNMRNVFIAFFTGIGAIVIMILSLSFFQLDFTRTLILAIIIIVIYAVLLFFLLEPKVLRKVHTKEIETIEKPVIKEVVRTVEKPVIREVEKPVIKEVVRRVFVEKPRKKLNIPHYEYVGSTETRTYHKRSCRLSKLIKRKYQISKNDPSYFQKNGFKKCKVCLRQKSK